MSQRRVAMIEPAGRGGIRHYTHALAEALTAEGLEVTVWTARDDELKGQSVSYRAERVFDRLRTPAWSVLRALRRTQPDVLHFQTATHPGLHAAFLTAAKIATKVSSVVTAHNVAPKCARRSDLWASEVLYRRADRVIVHGRAVEKEIRDQFRVSARKMRIIPHGESAHLVHGTIEPVNVSRDPAALFFGFLHPEKDPETLLRAWGLVHRELPNARLVIAGKPEMDLEPLFRLIEDLGISSAVEWRSGYLHDEDVHRCFQQSTLVVLPYAEASMSGVLFLAGAHDRPVIATRTGDLASALEDGVGGELVPPQDPERLGKVLVRWLSDRSKARRAGLDHGRRCRTRFSWSAIARKTEDVYRSLESHTEEIVR